jgi:hypothetical protein
MVNRIDDASGSENERQSAHTSSKKDAREANGNANGNGNANANANSKINGKNGKNVAEDEGPA